METSQSGKNINIGQGERITSIIGGGLLFLYSLKHSPLGSLVSAFLGAGLIYRGITGHSRLYESLDYSTAAEVEIAKDERARGIPPTGKVEGGEETSETTRGEPRVAPGPEPTAPAKRTPRYTSWTKGQLYEEAKKAGIGGRSKMTREELIESLQKGSS